MKKFILSGFSSFVVLFFLSLFSPLLSESNDAMAQVCQATGAGGTGTYTGCTAAGTGTSLTCTAAGTGGTYAGCVVVDYYSSNALVSSLCNIFKIVSGNGGKAFAAFAVLSTGIGFFTGKVSWGLMIGVAAGIALIFGAPSVVAAITGESAFGCEGSYQVST